jgi:ppGpp synthetase/RelA/SpoT-type nucleotidyltranferase
MATKLTKTQVDRLGDRLRKGNITEADLRLLDQYRRAFSEAYEGVVEAIRTELGLEPTGRPAKSTTSISDKLRRESIRLSQIQDIAGCRLIVADIANQNSVVESLTSLFEQTTVSDRREKPSHGYRAVHVIVNVRGKLIEIQVRTVLQQLWAEVSEKFSDVAGPEIKYGEGDKSILSTLESMSVSIAEDESLETLMTDDPELQKILLSMRRRFTDNIHKAMALLNSGGKE